MAKPMDGSATRARPPKVRPSLARLRSPLADPATQLARLDALAFEDGFGGDFDRHLEAAGLHPLSAQGVQILQLNLGRVCNQTCSHCHVDAGPDRTENMSHATAERCIELLAASDIQTVDITGGAPEMCPEFRYLVEEAHALGRHVMDRCNLTILTVPRYAELAEFLAQHQVEIVCSLPHYRQYSTDKQRGDGVYERSIRALQKLNALGYGKRGTGLKLVLVTNPVGAFLPGAQESLEDEWKREMKRLHDVDFDALYCITNMPISRYLEWLEGTDNLASYMQELVSSFNPGAAAGVMCRTTLSVGWDGRLFDCDFNQMLELEVGHGAPRHIDEFDLEALATRRIVTRRHCFGCTAGAGSSCGGETV